MALFDYWKDGPKTFLGIQTSGFPNLFFPGGPHAVAGNNPRYNGDQVDFVTSMLIYLRETMATRHHPNESRGRRAVDGNY